ncbi:MAG: metal ABC transporter permease [Myxococcaceae bacterium]|nr:metal ABC transporter permease [Myxococcaceae bacterium]
MLELLQYPFMVRGAVAVALAAVVLGTLSHVVVARRLAFFSTTVGQAAMTGVSVGVLLGEPLNTPWASIIGVCLLVALGLVYLRRRATLPHDALVGVFLALTLGVGVCLLVAVTKRFNIHALEAVMFGSVLTVTAADNWLLAGVGLSALITVALLYNRLMLQSVDGSLGRAQFGEQPQVEYVFMVVLTLALIVSTKVMGALMVEAMVLLPAVTARQWGRKLSTLVLLSIAVAVFSGEAGLLLSAAVHVPSGAAIVLMLSACFLGALVLRPRQQMPTKHYGS